MLLFGLWPLDFHPKNQVRWFGNQDGIQFHKKGILSKFSNRGARYEKVRHGGSEGCRRRCRNEVLTVYAIHPANYPVTIEVAVQTLL